MVAGLASDAFRAASLRGVAALKQSFVDDFRFGLFSRLFLLLLGGLGFLDGRGFIVVLGDDVFLALVLLLLRLCSHGNGRLLGLDVAHALVHHAQVNLNAFLARQWERRPESHQEEH